VSGSSVNLENRSGIYLPISVVSKLWKNASDSDRSSSINDESASKQIGSKINVTYTFIDPSTTSERTISKLLTIAGVTKPVGNPTIDSAVIINLEEGNEILHKNNHYDSLFVAADDTDHVEDVQKEIHNIYGTNIGITTSKAILKSIQDFTAGFGTVVYSIALVALVVGSIGIITTMYTSVTERTKEIGIMKAIGARDRNILALFLSETAIIGIIGATIGLAVGIIGGHIILLLFASKLPSPGVTPYYPPIDLIRVWFLSIGLSVTAGLYPAWKAARLSPISALRRE
jgi:putative ABC transport system permease protein